MNNLNFLEYIRKGVNEGNLVGKMDVYLAFHHLNKRSLLRRGTILRLAKRSPLTPTQFYAFL